MGKFVHVIATRRRKVIESGRDGRGRGEAEPGRRPVRRNGAGGRRGHAEAMPASRPQPGNSQKAAARQRRRSISIRGRSFCRPPRYCAQESARNSAQIHFFNVIAALLSRIY
jgi:hypothetical protein